METLKRALLVALGGALGALARWGLTLLVQRLAGDRFPWGTLAVNLLGCFAIGLFLPWLEGGEGERTLSPEARLLLVVGGLGAFTTFSSFEAEVVALLRGERAWAALAYVGGSVVLGLAAALAGRALALRFIAAP